MSYSYVDILLKKSKIIAISNIISECLQNDEPENTPLLHQVADSFLNPKERIDKPEIIEWIKWLLAAGKNPEEFSKEVIKCDTAFLCGLVWIANFVAYRCRTCAISPCMSLCADCFQKGDHEGHDFNMFRSLAGGACDCGDESVMKKSGFCVRHSVKKKDKDIDCTDNQDKNSIHNLLFVAKGLMSKIINRLLVELRRNDFAALEEIDVYITNLLNPLTSMGNAMRSVISKVLLDPKVYYEYARKCESNELERKNFLLQRYEKYLIAKANLPNFNMENFYTVCSKCPPNKCTLKLNNNDFNHNTFVEELLFWTIVYEFPQKLVCFLLNMLPDADFKQAFAKSFVYHYSRISMMFANNKEKYKFSSKHSAYDYLSNCVVHVSVQLLSNESLAVKLCEEDHLLFIIIASLKALLEGALPESSNLIQSTLQKVENNKHKVIKCNHSIMKKHSYWPIVNDLNNTLTHKRIALMFINNKELFELWLDILIHFQGMNLNTRELHSHVEYENDNYYTSFSSELEISATTLWTIINHIKNESSAASIKQVITCSLNFLYKWFKLIGFSYDTIPNPLQCTFHIPLHRYYSILLRHGVEYLNLKLEEFLPTSEKQLKLLLAHPLQIQVNFYEILCGLWVRNGLQIKGQAMSYIQCHFCSSMVDPDLFLIQQLASRLPADWFITIVLKRFHIYEWFSFGNIFENYIVNFKNIYKKKYNKNSSLEPEQVMPMIESALTFLCTLFTVQTNLGLTDEQNIRKEMVSLLCIADRTYSQLHDFLPEKCGTIWDKDSFDRNLSEIADFKKPVLESGGNLSQGMYCPKPEIWLNEYDPLYVLLRSANRRDYQSSIDRYTQFIKNKSNYNNKKNKNNKNKGKQSKQNEENSNNIWPPFRIPPDINSKFSNPRKLLYSKVLHGVIFTILYRALHTNVVSERSLALTIFLLQLSLHNNNSKKNLPAIKLNSFELSSPEVYNLFYGSWFDSNSLLENMNVVIQNVVAYESKKFKKKFFFYDRVKKVDENLDLSEEEMEVDLLSSNDENEDNFNEEEYMSGGEDHQRDNIEISSEIRQLPSSTVPLALTSGSSDQQSTSIVETTPVTRTDAFQTYLKSKIDELYNLINTFSTSSSTITSSSNLNSSSNANDNNSSLVAVNQFPIMSLGQSTSNLVRNENNENVTYPDEPTTSSQISRLNESVSQFPFSSLKFNSNFENYSNNNTSDRSSVSSPVPSSSRDTNTQISTIENKETAVESFSKDNLVVPHFSYNRKRSIEFKNLFQITVNQFNNYNLVRAIPNNPNLVKRTFRINESLISLLLKLCGPSFTYEFDENLQNINNRIGGLNHFIKQVFDLYCNLNVTSGKQAIQTCLIEMYPKNVDNNETCVTNQTSKESSNFSPRYDFSKYDSESPSSNLDKEERRRMAKERQKKLIAEFANKQKAFMNQMKDELQSSNQNNDFSDKKNLALDLCDNIQYECVICGQTTPSISERLVGMVVLLQSTSVLAHCTPKYPLKTLKLTKSLKETVKIHKERLDLIDEDSININKKQTLGNYMEERIELFDNYFDKPSWLNAINIGWEGGVRVQSCGHYLHLDCHCSYMKSLSSSRSYVRSGFENGEFLCPLCRQLANSVLPINPNLNKNTNVENYLKNKLNSSEDNLETMGEIFNFYLTDFFKTETLSLEDNEKRSYSGSTQSISNLSEEDKNELKSNSSNKSQNEQVANENDLNLSKFTKIGKDNSNCPTSSSNSEQNLNCILKKTSEELLNLYLIRTIPDINLFKSFGFFCEDLTKATGPQYRNVRTLPTKHSLYLFLCSILRTNLETELLVRISKSNPTGAKKSCFVPLFHAIALNCQFLLPNHYVSLWSNLTGLDKPSYRNNTFILTEKEVPLLLVDTCAILIQLLFALPLNVEECYFDAIVQNLYNLNVIQALAQISCLCSRNERVKYKKMASLENNHFKSCSSILKYIILFFENNKFSLYKCMDDEIVENLKDKWTSNEINDLVRIMCIPFIRISSLIKCYLYKREYPSYDLLKNEKDEYNYLTRLLNLSSSNNLTENNICLPLFSSDDSLKVLCSWLKNYSHFINRSTLMANKLLQSKPIEFVHPKLLNLPSTYDQLFLHYYKKTCSLCNACPKEPCICLLCSRLVCMRQDCCRRPDGPLEAIFHSQICGAGTAVFLAVFSSTVIVIRGRRACVWGSVYLDLHEEEDRDLKRGKPLYLSKLRYLVLEQQWLTHSFDHTNKKWVIHKDFL